MGVHKIICGIALFAGLVILVQFFAEHHLDVNKSVVPKPAPALPVVRIEGNYALSANHLVKTQEDNPAEKRDAWVLKVSTFTNQDNAAKEVSDLRTAGYNAFSLSAARVDNILYRVYVGPYISLNLAKQDQMIIDEKFSVSSTLLDYNLEEF